MVKANHHLFVRSWNGPHHLKTDIKHSVWDSAWYSEYCYLSPHCTEHVQFLNPHCTYKHNNPENQNHCHSPYSNLEPVYFNLGSLWH